MASVSTKQLLNYLDEQLQPQLWRDCCPNGLQVEGCEQIERIVTAVTATQAVLDAAVHCQAQAVLVHHGYFWRGEDPCIRGIKRKRLSTLLAHNLNLIAYHLPLDGHAEWGNNVQLSRLLDLRITGEFAYSKGPALALTGELPSAMTGAEFADYLAQKLQRSPFWLAGSADKIKRIGWSTGAAQDLIEEALTQNVDAYLTGEVCERTTHFSRDSGIYFYAAGHHATERYGVRALGEHLAAQFGIVNQYIEIDNPV